VGELFGKELWYGCAVEELRLLVKWEFSVAMVVLKKVWTALRVRLKGGQKQFTQFGYCKRWG